MRPELARYLALPPGWRFDTARDSIGFDLAASRLAEDR
ncbi:hypothetical protein [Komagataeibacter sp. NFXK3]